MSQSIVGIGFGAEGSIGGIVTFGFSMSPIAESTVVLQFNLSINKILTLELIR